MGRTPIGSMTPPDYANTETINRISTGGGSWTVEQDGYVYLNASVASHNSNAPIWFINGQSIAINGAQSGQISGWNPILPVKAGDVIQQNAAAAHVIWGSIWCYFIPQRKSKSISELAVKVFRLVAKA